MLWGIRNPFHGLGFGSESAEPSQPEHETGPEQQPAPEAEQSVASAMPWKAWHEVS